MLAGATSGIEHASDEISLPGEAFEGWLGTPDIPSGWSLRHIDGIEVVTRALHANHAARVRAALLTAQDGRLDSASAPVRIERLERRLLPQTAPPLSAAKGPTTPRAGVFVSRALFRRDRHEPWAPLLRPFVTI